jgi:tRNA threonylcarbamoyladenosine biosynthesis protein TsaE
LSEAREPISVQTSSPAETLEFGRRLGQSLSGALCVGLIGTLGAGKTHLVKGIALGNGMPDARKITSPTFTLIHEYTGRLTLYHIDVYRLRGPAELIALGLEELVGPDSVVLIEWADRAREAIPAPRVMIEIESIGPEVRRFTLTGEGPGVWEYLRGVAAPAD